jgi:DNA-binding NtrC family response regulator
MKKVAIIDDELEILNVLERLLSREKGLEVRVFSNPENAIEEVKNGIFDVVLLDIMMPQMDGIHFLKEVRKTNTSTKIIIMTAHSTLDRVLESHQGGADDYILKPFKSLAKVLEKVQAVL